MDGGGHVDGMRDVLKGDKMSTFDEERVTKCLPLMGPSQGGVRRGSGEAHFVSDFRVVFFGCRCRSMDRAEKGSPRGNYVANTL